MARSCVRKLEDLPDTETTLRRRLFYTLILAETHRRSDPLPYREAAMDLGERLEQMGVADPFRPYMRIIQATTNAPTTGNFGDLKTPSVELIWDTSSYVDEYGNEVVTDLAQRAVGLSDGHMAEFDKFLVKSLQEIARLHELAS